MDREALESQPAMIRLCPRVWGRHGAMAHIVTKYDAYALKMRLKWGINDHSHPILINRFSHLPG